MNNFEYYNPVKIIFGKNSVAENLQKELSCFDNVMIMYGSSSLKRCGAYDEIMTELKDKTVIEFSGITPNPKIEQLNEAVKIAKIVSFQNVVNGLTAHAAKKAVAGTQAVVRAGLSTMCT